MLLAAGPVRVLRAALVAVEARPARQARALPAHRVAAAGGGGGAARSEPGSAGRLPRPLRAVGAEHRRIEGDIGEARCCSKSGLSPSPRPLPFPFCDICPALGPFCDSGGFSTEGLSHWPPDPLTTVPAAYLRLCSGSQVQGIWQLRP